MKWRWLRGLAIWNRQPIRAQGGWLALIPVAAIVLSFAMAYYGNRNREWLETDIERKFHTANKLDELMALVVNAESGIRGYLLTGRTEFLEPYKIAERDLPQTFAELKRTAETDTDKQASRESLERLEKIEMQVGNSLAFFDETRKSAFSRIMSRDELFARLQKGKTMMDETRSSLLEIQAAEDRSLSASLNEIYRVRRRDYLFVIIALLIGLLARAVSFYLFDRGIVRRLERLSENARCLQRGEAFKFPISKKKDAVGCLEQELENLSQILGKNDTVTKSN
ncbi:MAG: CHASE3 domain-containing protein [Acidobacteriota bacterium]|nr:CHASE3 domain-containing protein [Acidobacteriota bacterium]